jgi:lysozyme
MPRDNSAGAPAPKPSPQPPSKAGMAAIIAAACACATPLIMASEGLRTRPYLDPVKIPTVCYGETQVEMRVYSRDECGRMLRERLARIYAPKVLACLPQLGVPERRHEFAAMIDSSYNAGPAAVCKSRMAEHIRAGRWAAACNSLQGWYVTARDRRTGVRKAYPGLVRRRIEAKHLCLKPEPRAVTVAFDTTLVAAPRCGTPPPAILPRDGWKGGIPHKSKDGGIA